MFLYHSWNEVVASIQLHKSDIFFNQKCIHILLYSENYIFGLFVLFPE